MQIQIAEAEKETMVIDRSQIVSMEEGSEKFWQRFSSDINFGISFQRQSGNPI